MIHLANMYIKTKKSADLQRKTNSFIYFMSYQVDCQKINIFINIKKNKKMSSSPNNNNNSDQEDHDESAEPSDDGETIEVDPLTFCQPEMTSEGQGEFEESIEEHDSDDENNEYSQFIQETNIPQNDDEFGEAEGNDPNAPNEEAEEPLVSPKKIPSVQLTAVNKKRESSERFEKENTSVPKVTITPIGSSQSSSPNKKEDPLISLNRKRKIENDFINSTIEKNVLLNKLPRTEAVLDHPIELRKLLFGDLAQEMCITVSRPGTNWKKELSPLDFDPDSSEVHRFSFGRNSSSTNGKRVTYYAFRTIFIRIKLAL